MQVINGTPYVVNSTQANDKKGDVHLLVVAKATYDFPEVNDEPLKLSDIQRTVYDDDLFEGAPGVSTPYFESNWSYNKPLCDILVKATGYPPEGHESETLSVGFEVGTCHKKVWIQGQQQWQKNSMGKLVLTPKQELTSTPITYSRSYGGSWLADEKQDDSFNAFFLYNPVGSGFAEKQHRLHLEGKTAPNIFPDESVMNASKAFKPVSFGPLGRHWLPRSQYAGTYDQNWIDNVYPKWPADLDERYFQAAPEDQQIAYPSGEEKVVLSNMHPSRSLIEFALPKKTTLPIIALMEDRTVVTLPTVIDTLEIDADAQQISIVWRAKLPLKRSLREVNTLALGKICKRWWRSHVFGAGDCGCGGIETDDKDLVVVTEAMELT